MHACHPLATLAVATHNQEMSQPLYNPTIKARGLDGQFLHVAPTCMTALKACNYTHLGGVDTKYASFSCSPGIPFLQAGFLTIWVWSSQQVSNTVRVLFR